VESSEYRDQIPRDDVGHIHAVDATNLFVDVRQCQVLDAVEIL
jgi:hypothetical protein